MKAVLTTRVRRARCFAVAAVLAVVVVGTAQAIVRRHDVRDAVYWAAAEDFPFVFGVYEPIPGHKDCLGMLIHPRWGVTAAHCITDTPLNNEVANGGRYPMVELGGRHYAIERIVRHPSWNGRFEWETWDIALVKLKSPVEDVPPVPLYEKSDEQGRQAIFVGWGATGTGVVGVTGDDFRFRRAENRIELANQRWLIFLFDDPRARKSRALAMEGISGHGDSGGPALIKTPAGWALAGISSSQKISVTEDGRRAEGVYGSLEYYTRVSTVLDWIRGVINGDGAMVPAP